MSTVIFRLRVTSALRAPRSTAAVRPAEILSHRLRIANRRLISPKCSGRRGGAQNRGASCGIDVWDNDRRAADHISQILKGAKVANLPFQEPTRVTLSTVPPALLARADNVIE
jgi:ABC-type uncharacterized transport system substrate-binding protein